MIRIHTAAGTIIPTSQYSLTDSVVVIGFVLRGKVYIPELTEAHLYGPGPAVKALPDSVALPLEVSMDQIVAVESWNFPVRPAPTGSAVRPRLAVYAAEKVVARIHTVDGTIIPTSRYDVIDSVLVIENVLRGDDYFREQYSPRVYGDPR